MQFRHYRINVLKNGNRFLEFPYISYGNPFFYSNLLCIIDCIIFEFCNFENKPQRKINFLKSRIKYSDTFWFIHDSLLSCYVFFMFDITRNIEILRISLIILHMEQTSTIMNSITKNCVHKFFVSTQKHTYGAKNQTTLIHIYF